MKVKCDVCDEAGEIEAEYGYDPFIICEGCFLSLKKERTIDGSGLFYVET